MNTRKSLALVGCGHTHALTLMALKAQGLDGADVHVIDPEPRAVYSGMLPGFIAGHYPLDALEIDIAAVTKAVGATHHQSRATALDHTARAIVLEDGTQLPFDVASFDVGITSRMPDLPGFAEHGVAAKPLKVYAARWTEYLKADGPAHVAVIGGGVAGAELAMAMAFRLKQTGRVAQVRLVDRGQALSVLVPGARRRVLAGLARHGVEVLENRAIAEVTPQGVLCTDGTQIAADFVVGAAGATPYPWVADLGLETRNGFLSVNQHLETSASGIFAAGDCAHFTDHPLPKAGVYAVRQGPIMATNLMAALQGKDPTPYVPQTDYLKLISLGDKTAVGEKWGFALNHPLVWRLKNRIDTGFMARFSV